MQHFDINLDSNNEQNDASEPQPKNDSKQNIIMQQNWNQKWQQDVRERGANNFLC